MRTDLAEVAMPEDLVVELTQVVRDGHGPAVAEQQLSHTNLATTEAHYFERLTHGPDMRATFDRFADGK